MGGRREKGDYVTPIHSFVEHATHQLRTRSVAKMGLPQRSSPPQIIVAIYISVVSSDRWTPTPLAATLITAACLWSGRSLKGSVGSRGGWSLSRCGCVGGWGLSGQQVG